MFLVALSSTRPRPVSSTAILASTRVLVQRCDGSLGDDTVNLLLIELFEIVKSLQALLDQSVDLSLGCGELLFRSRLGRLFLLLRLPLEVLLDSLGVCKVVSRYSTHLEADGRVAGLL